VVVESVDGFATDTDADTNAVGVVSEDEEEASDEMDDGVVTVVGADCDDKGVGAIVGVGVGCPVGVFVGNEVGKVVGVFEGIVVGGCVGG
jgi:hypothetical protein